VKGKHGAWRDQGGENVPLEPDTFGRFQMLGITEERRINGWKKDNERKKERKRKKEREREKKKEIRKKERNKEIMNEIIK